MSSARKHPNTFRLVVLPDVHLPYHHAGAWACALDVVRRVGADGLVQVGDLNSFDSVSSHPKDPKRILSLQDEIIGANVALDELDAAARKGGIVRSNKWLTTGNHEERLDRYALTLAPELRPFIDWRDMLYLDRRGWRVTPYKESLAIGELNITHDVGRAGVNAARQSLADMGTNVLFGHTHQVQVVYAGTVAGKRHVGATIGWLGDPECIDYRHRDLVRRSWQHAVAIVDFDATGRFWLNVVPIVAGRCIIDGEIYGI